jgi:hypothetical protein
MDEKKRHGNPKYYKGLGNKTSSEREKQFDRQGKMHWDDPSAYKEAPGDDSQTRVSKWTKIANKRFPKRQEDEMSESTIREIIREALEVMDEMEDAESLRMIRVGDLVRVRSSGEPALVVDIEPAQRHVTHHMLKVDVLINGALRKVHMYELEEINESLDEAKCKSGVSTALKNKAKSANAPMGALRAIYNKGLAAWRTGHRPGAGQHQWAMARVNSVLAGGPARKVDIAQWKSIQRHRKNKKSG